MATTKVVVEGSSVTASQLSELFRQIGDGSINSINLQRFLEHYPFALDAVVIDWERVYKALGMEFKPGDFVILPEPNSWDVCVQKGVTCNQVIKVLRGLDVQVYLYTDDYAVAVTNLRRDPIKGSYRVCFRKTIEADPSLGERSANDLDKAGIDGITLVERLLLELGYFLATGLHLDVKNTTLCHGSRDSGGNVPSVGWRANHRKLYVDWCGTGNRSAGLRSRAVVS